MQLYIFFKQYPAARYTDSGVPATLFSLFCVYWYTRYTFLVVLRLLVSFNGEVRTVDWRLEFASHLCCNVQYGLQVAKIVEDKRLLINILRGFCTIRLLLGSMLGVAAAPRHVFETETTLLETLFITDLDKGHHCRRSGWHTVAGGNNHHLVRPSSKRW